MPYKLSNDQIGYLISQPETGMGYQYVEANIYPNSEKGVVLNAEVFIPKSKIEKIMGRRYLTYSAILKEAESPGLVRDLRVISRSSLHLGESKFFAAAAKGPASEAEISETKEDEVFKRFSAYINDHRITEDGGLVPGTYATTEEDAKNVGTGSEATERYALPSDEPAIYVFTVKPPRRTKIRSGIVEPANGKRGGGVEVIFEEGSPEDTVTGPRQIPAN